MAKSTFSIERFGSVQRLPLKRRITDRGGKDFTVWASVVVISKWVSYFEAEVGHKGFDPRSAEQSVFTTIPWLLWCASLLHESCADSWSCFTHPHIAIAV